MQKITPFLWFDSQAEEAAKFYTSVFKNSKMGKVLRYDAAASKAAGRPEGSVLTVEFELEGLPFTALNGGPQLQMSGAVSFVITCETQEEIDYYWEKLSDGGEAGQCGWINRDKFGVTWQVVPAGLPELIKTPGGMQAMLGMTKFDIAALKAAADK
ncbi:MAG TPA: VOC family protein [Candidatus Paceibacterota bacterium]|jgi:predicted 3-demethylubiquinone-9 3-methyltransferase (glyoxalase superfamily)|nr:VOC family protein [Candidatus Paceibacterota bacterium]